MSGVQMPLTLLLLTIIIAPQYVHSYGTGAPTDVCGSMVPGHGAEPQKGSHPYRIILAKIQSADHGPSKWNITLVSNSPRDIFKGFFIQIRKPGSATKAYGTFQIPEKVEAKTVPCFNSPDSAVTHASGKPKTNVTVFWTPPEIDVDDHDDKNNHGQDQDRDRQKQSGREQQHGSKEDDGEYEIVFSVVGKDSKVYWVGQTHDELIRTDKAKPDGHHGGNYGLQDVYEGCGKTKGCFGVPKDCVTKFKASATPKSSPCSMIVTWKKKGDTFEFQLAGQVDKYPDNKGYVAVGFSTDRSMGNDSVVGCISDSTNSNIHRYYNPGYYNQKYLQDPTLGISNADMVVRDGNIICSFEQTSHHIENLDIDFDKHRYHLLMAKASDFNENKLGKHKSLDDTAVSMKGVFIDEKVIVDDKRYAGKNSGQQVGGYSRCGLGLTFVSGLVVIFFTNI